MTQQLTDTITMWHRRDWSAREPSGEMSPNTAPLHGFVHHTTDPLAEYMDTLPEMKAAVRGIQRYHMDFHGWRDGGYHYIVFQPYGNREFARVFQMRLPIYVPAAQSGYNARTIAIAVVGNFQGDDAVKRNTRHAIEVLLNRHPSLRTLGGHRDAPGQSTTCPGDTLEAHLDTIARASNLQRMSHRVSADGALYPQGPDDANDPLYEHVPLGACRPAAYA